jgi:hypothetical protein
MAEQKIEKALSARRIRHACHRQRRGDKGDAPDHLSASTTKLTTKHRGTTSVASRFPGRSLRSR